MFSFKIYTEKNAVFCTVGAKICSSLTLCTSSGSTPIRQPLRKIGNCQHLFSKTQGELHHTSKQVLRLHRHAPLGPRAIREFNTRFWKSSQDNMGGRELIKRRIRTYHSFEYAN